MQEHHITVDKTARYYVLGEPSDKLKYVWFVCHGYAQLAQYFLKKFEPIDNGEHLIIAPEGLHRFYWEGYSGRVVASWMTKEDRLNDIKDYTNYLDKLYASILSQCPDDVKVNLLGFSQGAATTCRWVCNGKAKADNFILWAGVFPPDLNFEVDKHIFNQMNTLLVIGDEDEFINEDDILKQEAELKDKGIDYQLVRFKGNHTIDEAPLKELLNHLR